MRALVERATDWFRRLRSKRYFPLLVLIFGLPAVMCGGYLLFPPPQTNILVMGVDSRDGEGWVTRADSIMLVGIDPAHLGLAMLAIPRDLSINVPDYGLQRINTVNMLGEMAEPGSGPRLLAAGIRQDFGVESARYVRLDFKGFVRLVDAVGGVTIDVPSPLIDYEYPTADYGVTTVQFDAGLQQMDGERALIYARTRHADDDYRRAERQQQVVSALLAKLINPAYWPAALNVLSQAVDTNLSLWDMLVLAPPVLVHRGHGEMLVIDRAYITATADGTAIPDYEKIAPWLQAYFGQK